MYDIEKIFQVRMNNLSVAFSIFQEPSILSNKGNRILHITGVGAIRVQLI